MTGPAPVARVKHETAAALAALAILLGATRAAAQAGFGQPGGGFTQPGGQLGGSTSGKPAKKAPAKKVPESEETHAATTGDGNAAIQTQEPTLPQDPLALPPDVEKRIGTSYDKDDEHGRGTKTERDFYGLYYQEKSGNYRFRTLFPLWAERKMPNDRASLFGFYYNRRSTNVDADVLFPFFWKLRDGNTHTTIALPFMHRERKATAEVPGRHDNWFAPLFFEGSSTDGSGYFHVPPLLTFTQHTARGGFNLAGPLFCKWRGGPSCDPRTTDDIDLGIAPLYFYGRDENREYELIPPLLHYYRYSDIGDKSLNIWGPVMMEHSPESDVFNILPLFWRNWGKNESHTTVFPLFHYGYKGRENLIITPLFLNSTGEEGEKTFVTWGYARYRGRTELDMFTPLVWLYRDPDIGLDRKIILPFVYRSSSPRSSDTVVFPFYARFNKPGLSDTTWITPLFRTTKDTTGWETDLFPIFYAGRSNRSTHLVVAPFLWDFASPRSRTTLALPFFFRFADDQTVSQLALNTYYRQRKVPGGTDWEFHFFPLFSYGQSPTGYWWNLMYGLAGYSEDGTTSKVRAFYIPIKLSK